MILQALAVAQHDSAAHSETASMLPKHVQHIRDGQKNPKEYHFLAILV